MNEEAKRRSVVQTSGRPASGSKLWAFGYRDFALLNGMSEAAVRQRVRRGDFKPGSLVSICEFWRQREEQKARRRTGEENSPEETGPSPDPELL
jgi:hypothetical protein